MRWEERIERARVSGSFTEQDREDAAVWVTCACGEQTSLIRRRATGEPLDVTLAMLGCDFSNAVASNSLDRAERILRSIEIRAASVIAEQGVP